jgi:hypothetical protein
MAGEVVPLHGRKPAPAEELTPGRTGPAMCMRCQHRFDAAVTNKELEERDGWFDCPSCPNLGCARFIARHGYSGDVWKCAEPCGNTWFHIVPDGWFCPNCGKTSGINKPRAPA